jgi:RHS repeat-associated protein
LLQRLCHSYDSPLGNNLFRDSLCGGVSNVKPPTEGVSVSHVPPRLRSIVRPRNIFCALAALLGVFGPSALMWPWAAQAATHISTTTYTSNTTWSTAGSPYILDGNVTVAAGATLTIDPGVVVKFNGTLRQLIVNGTLTAVGTAGSHITFTSYQDDSVGGDSNGDGSATQGQPGQWMQIQVSSGNTASHIQYADARYGANGSTDSGYGALKVTSAGTSVTVEDSTFSQNQRSAILVGTGSNSSVAGVIVRRTTISNNANGVSANMGWMTVEDSTSIHDNSADGLWFNLTSSYTGQQSVLKDSESRLNGRGVYLQVDATLDSAKWPRGKRNNIFSNTNKQLDTLNTKRTADWKSNYWGDGVFFVQNPSVCRGTGQDSPGKLAFYSSQSTPPAGPNAAGTYQSGTTTCAYDKVAIGRLEFQPFPFRGTAGDPPAQSIGSCGGYGEFGENQTGCTSDPVNSATGSAFATATDLKLPGIGVTFAFTRTYNAIDDTVGPLGPGWTHSYNAALTIKADGEATARGGSGQQLEFAKNADGSFTAAVGGRATLTAITGGYELVTFDQRHYRFDTAGKLTSLFDRNGQGLTFAYNGNGQLATITDSASRQIILSYTSGLLTQVALPDGRSVSYAYTSGRLTSVTDARGKVWTYTYDSYGFLEKEVDPLQHTVFRNVYGSDGRVIEQYDGLNHKTTFSWNSAIQTQTTTDARGKVWKDIYSNGLLVQQVDPLNDITTITYDSDLNVSSIVDARNKTTSMTYDSRGNLLTRTAPSPLSYQQTFTYNSQNEVLTAQDGRGNTTSFGYDTAGNLTSITRPGNNVTQYGRDSSGNGLLRTITDPRGKVMSLDYDAAGNLTAVTTSLGNKTTMSYDGSGRMTASVEPRGNVTGADPNDYKTTYTYNAKDQPLTVTDPLGHVSTYAYDDAGRLTSSTDPLTHATTYGYNDANRLTTVTADGGATTTYAYDAVNDITSRTDANNHQTTYSYDDANRISSATNALNKTWSFTYDANGNRTGVTKPSGAAITIAYDAINRPSGVSFSDSTPSISYTYDGNSNRTQLTDGAGTQTYTYDALNRLTGVSRSSDNFTYDYDAAGNVTTRTYPGGTTITSTYDDDGRLASVTRSGNTANYSYDAAGNPVQITLPNSYIESRTYDRAGRTTQVKHSTGASTLAQFDYAYDAAGSPTSVTTPSSVTTYGYDSRDRLTSVCFQASCPGGSDPFIRWTYDAVGNRLTESRPAGTTNYTYDTADEMTAAGATSYSYDVDGNETQAGSRTFSWSAAGIVTSTTASGVTTNYSYDGDGNRVQASSGGQTTNYLWDVNGNLARLAVERDGSGNSMRSYTYGTRLLSMVASGQTYYFHGDAIGSVRNVTSSSGQTEWTYSYEPFGAAQTVTKNDPMAPDNPIRFAGELLDSDTGLYDLRARLYDASAGRFLSLDPLASTQERPYVGSYVYAADSPARYVDPSGLGPIRSDDSPPVRRGLNPLERLLIAKGGTDGCVPRNMPTMLPAALMAFWIQGYQKACARTQSWLRAHWRPITIALVMTGSILVWTGMTISIYEGLPLIRALLATPAAGPVTLPRTFWGESLFATGAFSLSGGVWLGNKGFQENWP